MITPKRYGSTSAYEIRISTRLRKEWVNGHRDYMLDVQKLRVPPDSALQPSQQVLEWHTTKRFRG